MSAWGPLRCLLLALVLGGATQVDADAAQQAQVSVDWSRVADADVQRCGLSRLRAGTIERLVDTGHAVVDAIDARGVAVAVASVQGGLRIDVTSGGIARSETLPLADDCDATFVLDVISRTVELVGEVARARPAVPRPETEPTNAPQATTKLLGAIDLMLRASEAGSIVLGGGVTARLRFPPGFEAGVRAEVAGNEVHGVRILEGFVGLSGAYQPAARGLGLYFEAGPVLHAASSEPRSVTEADARLGAGVQVSFGHLIAHLLASTRLRRFEHRVNGDDAFDTGQLAVTGRIGGQLPGL